MEEIKDRIKRLRKQRGLSMEALADQVGVKWQAVQKWENGTSAPNRHRISAVAKALGTTKEYLLVGQEPLQATILESERGTYSAAPMKIIPIPKSKNREISEIIELLDKMSEKGHVMLLTHARAVAKEYPRIQSNRSS